MFIDELYRSAIIPTCFFVRLTVTQPFNGTPGAIFGSLPEYFGESAGLALELGFGIVKPMNAHLPRVHVL